MPDIHSLLTEYLTSRGLTMPADGNALKVVEEANELAQVCIELMPNRTRLAHEIADVVLAAAVVAAHHGMTVEEAIRSKIHHDKDRNRIGNLTPLNGEVGH